jgi:hypothetical protein
MARQEGWLTKTWRPAMAWMYLVVCVFDFIFFPIGWSILQSLVVGGIVTQAWGPLTLAGGGLFHVAMGAVLGISAWSRGQEKISGVYSSDPQSSTPIYTRKVPTQTDEVL